jgi:site-specific recombinase XerD
VLATAERAVHEIEAFILFLIAAVFLVGAMVVSKLHQLLSAGGIGTPKSGAGRDVDLSQPLADRLARLRVTRATAALRQGSSEVPPWIFWRRTGQPFHPRVIQLACAAVLVGAELPAHFTLHCVRHTFASLLLSDGVSPAYV